MFNYLREMLNKMFVKSFNTEKLELINKKITSH